MISRVADTIAVGARRRLLRHRVRCAGVPGRAHPPAPASEDELQQPGLVQPGRRQRASLRSRRASSTASRTRWSRSSRSPRPRACSSSTAAARAPTCPPSALLDRVAGRRRHRERTGVVHEGLRRLRRRHQERRHHPSRRQDGHPQRRSSRRRGVHHLQGERGAQGVGADRGRLRQFLHRRGIRARSSSRTATTRCA